MRDAARESVDILPRGLLWATILIGQGAGGGTTPTVGGHLTKH